MKERGKGGVKDLEALRRRLEAWREGHGGRRMRIPEELWGSAVEAARRYGVSEVAKALHLNSHSLRKRMVGGKRSREGVPQFVELISPMERGVFRNAIAIEKACGSKVRIEFSGELGKELAVLSERLWRAAR